MPVAEIFLEKMLDILCIASAAKGAAKRMLLLMIGALSQRRANNHDPRRHHSYESRWRMFSVDNSGDGGGVWFGNEVLTLKGIENEIRD